MALSHRFYLFPVAKAYKIDKATPERTEQKLGDRFKNYIFKLNYQTKIYDLFEVKLSWLRKPVQRKTHSLVKARANCRSSNVLFICTRSEPLRGAAIALTQP